MSIHSYWLVLLPLPEVFFSSCVYLFFSLRLCYRVGCMSFNPHRQSDTRSPAPLWCDGVYIKHTTPLLPSLHSQALWGLAVCLFIQSLLLLNMLCVQIAPIAAATLSPSVVNQMNTSPDVQETHIQRFADTLLFSLMNCSACSKHAWNIITLLLLSYNVGEWSCPKFHKFMRYLFFYIFLESFIPTTSHLTLHFLKSPAIHLPGMKWNGYTILEICIQTNRQTSFLYS